MEKYLTTNYINWHKVSNMTGYKRSILERQNLLNVLAVLDAPKEHLKILEQFQKNVAQGKIGKTLKIPPFTVHNIIRRFRESEGQVVHREKGRWSKLNEHDLGEFMWHYIKNRYDSLLDITAWAREHLQKTLSGNTVCCAIHKCNLKLYHPKKK